MRSPISKPILEVEQGQSYLINIFESDTDSDMQRLLEIMVWVSRIDCGGKVIKSLGNFQKTHKEI